MMLLDSGYKVKHLYGFLIARCRFSRIVQMVRVTLCVPYAILRARSNKETRPQPGRRAKAHKDGMAHLRSACKTFGHESGG